MDKFLRSIGKQKTISSSNIKSTKENKFNEETMAYRSFAQKEYSEVVYNFKANVASATQ